jgi:hypothetical protein
MKLQVAQRLSAVQPTQLRNGTGDLGNFPFQNTDRSNRPSASADAQMSRRVSARLGNGTRMLRRSRAETRRQRVELGSFAARLHWNRVGD